MRHYVYCLILPMFLGCSGKNIVSGQDQTDAERLTAELPSWCESTCERVLACGVRDGDELIGGGACKENCQSAFSPYGRSDLCAGIGLEYQACLDRVTCEQLAQGGEPDCAPSNEARDTCEDEVDEGGDISGSGGSSNAPIPSGSGGTITYAGSYTGGSASGGAGVGGTSATGPSVTCEVSGDSGSAGSANGSGRPYVTCEGTRSECSDGHRYSWICVDDASGHNWCSCFIDGAPVGALEPALVCPSLEEMNAVCSWNLSEI